jgi:hypothetical protein
MLLVLLLLPPLLVLVMNWRLLLLRLQAPLALLLLLQAQPLLLVRLLLGPVLLSLKALLMLVERRQLHPQSQPLHQHSQQHPALLHPKLPH